MLCLAGNAYLFLLIDLELVGFGEGLPPETDGAAVEGLGVQGPPLLCSGIVMGDVGGGGSEEGGVEGGAGIGPSLALAPVAGGRICSSIVKEGIWVFNLDSRVERLESLWFPLLSSILLMSALCSLNLANMNFSLPSKISSLVSNFSALSTRSFTALV